MRAITTKAPAKAGAEEQGPEGKAGAEEQGHHQAHQHQPRDAVAHQHLQAVLHNRGHVLGDFQLDIATTAGFFLVDKGFQGIHHPQGIVVAVLVDLQNDGALAVEIHPFFFPFVGLGDGGNVAQRQHSAGLSAYNRQLGEGLQGTAFIHKPQLDVLAVGLDGAQGHVQVLAVDGPGYVAYAEAILA